MSAKHVYFFGGKTAEDTGLDAKGQKELLGGKGANLAEMCRIGIPVPPGFTITTEVCAAYYEQGKKIPEAAVPAIEEALKKVEAAFGGRKLGDPADPLLVSVRSGAALSMPGMMNTILNLGLTDASVEGLAKKTGNPRFAYDSYRRLIDMFGSTAMGCEHEKFEHEIHEMKKAKGVKLDTDLSADDLKELVTRYKAVYKAHVMDDFPQDPKKQLFLAVNAVFNSWNGNKAIEYRRIERITGLRGTAVNVQAMVFGNMGGTSGTGVAFTRDPNTGENVFYGDYLINAQGEDVVAGIRTPEPIAKLHEDMPKVYEQLVGIRSTLEKHYKEMQDIEFTVQEGVLYMLQTRSGKRTGTAAVRIAVEMVKEGLIDETTAVKRVAPDSLNHLLQPQLDPKSKVEVVAQGIAASPGGASGIVLLSAEAVVAHAEKNPNDSIMLVRKETSPEDVAGMHLAKGILTSTGGKASHAAVVARGWGKPCVVGCEAMKINEEAQTITIAGKTVKAGEFLTINGTTGDVMIGKVPTVAPSMTGDFATLMTWADKGRKLKIRTNADAPADAAKAREFGAEGIGLCRTEHMFFGKDRIAAVREMILATSTDDRKKALAKIEPFQKADFVGIFEAMDGYPVTIRLLDPPLHEFLPQKDNVEGTEDVARQMGVPVSAIRERVDELHEMNPMMGFRGCRLPVVFPEIGDMQVRAIIEAAIEVKKKGKSVLPEIMIPLVGVVEELTMLKKRAIATAEECMTKAGIKVEYQIGTMIELPRAALTADEIAAEAEFFSFGTNDLTQMTFGFSRDDIKGFMPTYLKEKILPVDPFQSIDVKGVGKLIDMGIKLGRESRKAKHGQHLKVGICGEHGGDPDSVVFCHKVGMDYVSCSPFRVPIARLAAAQAALGDTARDK
ncbi:pyruvate phosphate dikinase : Pyruvate, phosphate dikinase OS=Singulisphaera acidiphila (strain ATCC BAA-1392 / DSM 18658 / VKM B-2454 / MOB10) GN=Sinac_6461 PE=4 SV=1: PPDK_N: PEP-utilizers: PEP-utilizers_C [Gemmata massiliana]|uniref:Pyruvate, phosphate dikinase n=1 Tax=Gemmata massiliana TaxID=1210884 RepID=A0A6P2CUS3_9BACT|nr:pyruvate, phosphate dikinase [Gemmata massiliana]VTR92317.1 pyruvate phosphate dikinase : Pyruvate, phosphate dikinase OS=Singulisphaera acidiphila (strain ATCC BAA-1392 / DSM 18658 / VKM B-2454 / MOB10) GN=Sinac_6461 PE=4 SV=1: PPDK_N: PEP-utilizers: PEP-utilizers_C [Gemmata massiliana]